MSNIKSDKEKGSYFTITSELGKETKEHLNKAYDSLNNAYDIFKKATGISINVKFSVNTNFNSDSLKDTRVHHDNANKKIPSKCFGEDTIKNTIQDCRDAKFSPKNMEYIYARWKESFGHDEFTTCDELFVSAINDAQNDWQ